MMQRVLLHDLLHHNAVHLLHALVNIITRRANDRFMRAAPGLRGLLLPHHEIVHEVMVVAVHRAQLRRRVWVHVVVLENVIDLRGVLFLQVTHGAGNGGSVVLPMELLVTICWEYPTIWRWDGLPGVMQHLP